MTEYRMNDVKFDATEMTHMLQTPTGEVGRYLGVLGLRIVVMARRLCGDETGRLSKSIRTAQTRTAGGQQLRVFSNVNYAYLVHEGTRPHMIDPPGDRIMAFNAGGKRVYTQRVHHPGTRGKRYLTIPLRQVIK